MAKFALPKLNLKISLPGEVASIESPWIQKLRDYESQQDPKIYAFAEALYAKVLHFSRSHPHIRRHCPHCLKQTSSYAQPQSQLKSQIQPLSPTKSINYQQKCIPITPDNENNELTHVNTSFYSNDNGDVSPIPITPSSFDDKDLDIILGNHMPTENICCYYNLLFLDADGVIVPTKSLKEFPSKEHMLRLKRIIDELSPQLSIIISSSWRSSADHLYSLCCAFFEIGINYQKVIIGCIPSCKDESIFQSRAEERNACIRAWFQQMQMEHVDVCYDESHGCYASKPTCLIHTNSSSLPLEETNISEKDVTPLIQKQKRKQKRKEKEKQKLKQNSLKNTAPNMTNQSNLSTERFMHTPVKYNFKTPTPSQTQPVFPVIESKTMMVSANTPSNDNDDNSNDNDDDDDMKFEAEIQGKMSKKENETKKLTSIKLPTNKDVVKMKNSPISTNINTPDNNTTNNSNNNNNNNNNNSTKKVMKVWKSKSPHFYVNNYLIVDDFGLSGKMIERHFLRTTSSVGMTDNDMEFILQYFRQPPPPGISHRSKKSTKKRDSNVSNKLHISTITPSISNISPVSEDDLSKQMSRTKHETFESITEEDDNDQKFKGSNEDRPERRKKEEEDGDDEDEDGDREEEDEEDDNEEESSEEEDSTKDLFAHIDPDILMMIPSAQD